MQNEAIDDEEMLKFNTSVSRNLHQTNHLHSVPDAETVKFGDKLITNKIN